MPALSHIFYSLKLGAAISGSVISNQPLSISIARVPCSYGCHQQDQFTEFPGASVIMCCGPVGTCTAAANAANRT